MNRESLNIKGVVTIKRFDGLSHELLNEITINNLIVNTGLKFFAEKTLDLTDEVIDKIGVGNGYKIPELEDSFLVRSAEQVNLNTPHDTFLKNIRFKSLLSIKQLFAETTFAEAEYGGKEIAEIGLFTNSNTLIARTILDPRDRFEKRLDDYVSISWKITFG